MTGTALFSFPRVGYRASATIPAWTSFSPNRLALVANRGDVGRDGVAGAPCERVIQIHVEEGTNQKVSNFSIYPEFASDFICQEAKNMNPDIFYDLDDLPTAQDRLDRIGEYYARGKRILEEIAAHEVAETLCVDVDGFSPISPIVDWKFTAEPNSSPEESDLEQEMAQDVVSHLYRSDIDRGRLEELEKMAEEIDNSDDVGDHPKCTT